MGQKVHPLGFRLNITKKHKSIWYTPLNNYAIILEQDAQIRDFIFSNFNSAYIVSINIERIYNASNIFLKIYVARPEYLIGKSGSILLDLNKNLANKLSIPNKFVIDILEIKKPDSHSILLAYFIAKQLVGRVAFKRAVRKAIKRARTTRIRGIKVQVSGRLNGAEIARSEFIKEGGMPLQTLRANIDYATATAKTIYGSIGIKIWLFKGRSK